MIIILSLIVLLTVAALILGWRWRTTSSTDDIKIVPVKPTPLRQTLPTIGSKVENKGYDDKSSAQWQGSFPGYNYGYYPSLGWGYYGYDNLFVPIMLMESLADTPLADPSPNPETDPHSCTPDDTSTDTSGDAITSTPDVVDTSCDPEPSSSDSSSFSSDSSSSYDSGSSYDSSPSYDSGSSFDSGGF